MEVSEIMSETLRGAGGGRGGRGNCHKKLHQNLFFPKELYNR